MRRMRRMRRMGTVIKFVTIRSIRPTRVPFPVSPRRLPDDLAGLVNVAGARAAQLEAEDGREPAVEGRRLLEGDAQDGRAGLVNEDGLRAVRDVRQPLGERPRVLELRRDTETARPVNVAVELRAGGGRAGFQHLAGDVVALVHTEPDGGQPFVEVARVVELRGDDEPARLVHVAPFVLDLDGGETFGEGARLVV